jgi:hypothetical protein
MESDSAYFQHPEYPARMECTIVASTFNFVGSLNWAVLLGANSISSIAQV